MKKKIKFLPIISLSSLLGVSFILSSCKIETQDEINQAISNTSVEIEDKALNEVKSINDLKIFNLDLKKYEIIDFRIQS